MIIIAISFPQLIGQHTAAFQKMVARTQRQDPTYVFWREAVADPLPAHLRDIDESFASPILATILQVIDQFRQKTRQLRNPQATTSSAFPPGVASTSSAPAGVPPVAPSTPSAPTPPVFPGTRMPPFQKQYNPQDFSNWQYLQQYSQGPIPQGYFQPPRMPPVPPAASTPISAAYTSFNLSNFICLPTTESTPTPINPPPPNQPNVDIAD